jgi:hypothetical protein
LNWAAVSQDSLGTCLSRLTAGNYANALLWSFLEKPTLSFGANKHHKRPTKSSGTLLSFSCRDIVRLWQISLQRYAAPRDDVVAAMGSDYSMWKDFPEEPGQAGGSSMCT